MPCNGRSARKITIRYHINKIKNDEYPVWFKFNYKGDEYSEHYNTKDLDNVRIDLCYYLIGKYHLPLDYDYYVRLQNEKKEI